MDKEKIRKNAEKIIEKANQIKNDTESETEHLPTKHKKARAFGDPVVELE